MQTLLPQAQDWCLTKQLTERLISRIYADFMASYVFEPIAVENLGP